MYNWKDLNRQYSEGNSMGCGFAVGEDEQTPTQAAQEEGWEILDTDTDGTVLAVNLSGQAVVIGDAHGAWGVEVNV